MPNLVSLRVQILKILGLIISQIVAAENALLKVIYDHSSIFFFTVECLAEFMEPLFQKKRGKGIWKENFCTRFCIAQLKIVSIKAVEFYWIEMIKL